MDPRTHRRFLTYLETFGYFREPGQKRLDVATWRELDAELVALEAKAEREVLDVGERARLRELERALMRD